MNYAQIAWDATKDADDPTFYNTKGEHRADLQSRADDAVKTGITNNLFEETVVQLHAADEGREVVTPLGTTGIRFDAASVKVDASAIIKTAAAAKVAEQEALKALAAAKKK